MSLPISTIGVDSGLAWETNLNAALTLIDAHDHSPGLGAPIQPSSLNINANLPFNNNNAITLRSVRFTAQPAALALVTDLGCVYVAGVDLYYNDSSGNQIRLTQSGSIVGTSGSITGLPSGTASASFAAATFTFQSATNTAASIDGRNLILRNSTASSNGLTISPPSAMGSNYSLVMPTIPGVTSIMALDTSGNISAPYTVDNSSIEINANVIRVKALGITNAMLAGSIDGGTKITARSIISDRLAVGAVTATELGTNAVTTVKIADNNVTPAKRSAALYANTNAGGTITTAAGTPCTFTGTGRPVLISVSMENGGQSELYMFSGGSGTLEIYKNNAPLAIIRSAIVTSPSISFDCYTYIDASGNNGTLTYDLRTANGVVSTGSGSALRIVASEL